MTQRIVAFPLWQDNPYLNILYLAARARGVELRGPTVLGSLLTEVSRTSAGDVIHIHWTSPLCQRARTDAEAERNFARLRAAVARAQKRGARLLWTVHNVLPHELTYPDVELRLCRWLADTADQVIVLSVGSPAVVGQVYTLPAERTTVLPHSSYWGVYPSEISQRAARATLGVPLTAPVVGFLGQLRPYKGVPTLLRAVELVQREQHRDVVLLLAGKTPADAAEQLERMLPPKVRVIRAGGFIADEDLQMWITASDVMVFPYEKVLNSGSMFLSATFGRPCILPDEQPISSDFGGLPWVHLYPTDGDAPRALASAIVTALATAGPDGAEAARFAQEHLPWTMATEFDALIRRVAS